MENKIQIITYADSLGKNIKELEKNLDKYFSNVVGGIHLLPFYPSSGDRGFAPLTHLEINHGLGSWEDIKNLSEKYILMADIIVNHISADSFYFKDYLKKGKKSKYSNYFITNNKFSRRILPHRKNTPIILDFIEKIANKFRDIDRIFHSTGVNKFSLKKIYRPRAESPLVPFVFKDGTIEHLWCTFTKDQIDLDIYNENVRKILESYIVKLSENGVKILRLDAVGYLVKKRGTNSFMLPETFELINWLGNIAHKNGALILPEVHNHYNYQIKLYNIRNTDYVYDFQIPFLVLHAIYNKTTINLKNWLKIRPSKTVNVLDTHDGIPVIDVEDLLSEEEIDKTKEEIIQKGGNETRRASGDNEIQNVDTYQINCTYYSALGEDDDAYILARAIQFFIPGISQVYYVGLLVGKNDIEKMNETNVGRDINRHNYTSKEIKNELQREVVKRLMKMMDFRNNYPIFDGKFSVIASNEEKLLLRWKKNKLYLEVDIDLIEKKVTVVFFDEKSNKQSNLSF